MTYYALRESYAACSRRRETNAMKAERRMTPSHVTTHSGYKADEYPLTFTVADGHTLTVVDIEDRWYGPGYSYFRVFADDTARYILRRNNESAEWAVQAL